MLTTSSSPLTLMPESSGPTAPLLKRSETRVLAVHAGWGLVSGGCTNLRFLLFVHFMFLLRFEHLHSLCRHLGLLKPYLTEYASTAMPKWVWKSPLRTCLPAVTAVVWGKLDSAVLSLQLQEYPVYANAFWITPSKYAYFKRHYCAKYGLIYLTRARLYKLFLAFLLLWCIGVFAACECLTKG